MIAAVILPSNLKRAAFSLPARFAFRISPIPMEKSFGLIHAGSAPPLLSRPPIHPNCTASASDSSFAILLEYATVSRHPHHRLCTHRRVYLSQCGSRIGVARSGELLWPADSKGYGNLLGCHQSFTARYAGFAETVLWSSFATPFQSCVVSHVASG